MENNIQRLTLAAARLLLAWVYGDAFESVDNTAAMRDRAGLTVEQYQAAYAELLSLGFVEYEGESVRVYLGKGGMLHA